MAFKTLFLAHAPDADKEQHRCFIDTGKYQLDVVIVKNQAEALEVSTRLFKEKQIESILLCPGFTHKDIAEIVAATDNKVAVCVSRSDGPGGRLSQEALKRAGFF
jgi:DNA-binding LacI/PurR family transcriptional regulator